MAPTHGASSRARALALFASLTVARGFHSVPVRNPRASTSRLQALQEGNWDWDGRATRYLFEEAGSAPRKGSMILVHGFGASGDYYRDNLKAYAAAGWNVYAPDLLGFGGSAKPVGDTVYSIDLWKQQVLDFAAAVVPDEDYVLAGNSIGGLVAVSSAAGNPNAKGLLLFNCAGGMNSKHFISDDLTPWNLKLAGGPIFLMLDVLLKNDGFANWFFERTKTPENVATTLRSVYVNKNRVDEDLVASILAPADDPNALEVFVRILTGDPGTSPDKLMPMVDCDVKLVWGDDDPFTPLDGAYGMYFRELAEDASMPRVKMSIVNAGHCPHDDAPEEVHRVTLPWLDALVS